jgi:hypothetical protein
MGPENPPAARTSDPAAARGVVSLLALLLREETPMHRPLLTQLALAAVLALATACGGAPKHAESPDPTESGWSGASSDSASSSATKGSDAPLPATSLAKTEEPKGMTADSPPAAKPETSSAAEADVVSGAALPPPPNAPTTPKAAKPAKAKKPAKTRKKATQAARG